MQGGPCAVPGGDGRTPAGRAWPCYDEAIIRRLPLQNTKLVAMCMQEGPALFQAEMEALLQVSRFGAWPLTTNEASDLLWALANARHWTEKLSDIEGSLIKVCGCITAGRICLLGLMPA